LADYFPRIEVIFSSFHLTTLLCMKLLYKIPSNFVVLFKLMQLLYNCAYSL
jgi:hypothetical protein